MEPDFGCEGCPEGQEIKDKVFLKQETTKEEMIIYMEDKYYMTETSTKEPKS